MFEVLMESIIKWNATKNERQKLQHCYLVLTVVIILIAGIVSLIDTVLGHNIVKLALIALTTFVVNAVGWNLLQSTLIYKLPKTSKRKK